MLIAQKRYDEAAEALRESLVSCSKGLPPDHQYVSSAEHYLGQALMESGQLTDAEGALTAAMNRYRRTSDAPPWRAARSASLLGEVLYRQGRLEDAQRYLTLSFQEICSDKGADPDMKRVAKERVIKFYTARGRRPELDGVLRECQQAALSVE